MLETYFYNLLKTKKTNFIGNIIKFILLLFSYSYYLVIEIRQKLYYCGLFKIFKLNCKIISVGNITLGGTGKTPMVEFLAKELKKRGRKVAVLGQGYKKQSSVKKLGNPTIHLLGDEGMFLKEKLGDIPLLIGKNRIKIGKEAIEKYKVDTLILDDGFQYQCLNRDLDIILIDATDLFGNGYLFPRGFLREPLKNIRRADFIILTKINLISDGEKKSLIEKLVKQFPQIPIFEAEYKPIRLVNLITNEQKDLKNLNSKKVGIFSAIANPFSFLNILQPFCKVKVEIAFPDHYQYKLKDIKKVINACLEKNIHIVITTEKDAVKLNDFFHLFEENLLSLFSLVIKVEMIKKKENLDAFINFASSNQNY